MPPSVNASTSEVAKAEAGGASASAAVEGDASVSGDESRATNWIVGCLLSKKKQKALCFPDMQTEARALGITLKAINEEEPIKSQGPFDAIVHKMTDILLAADNGDAAKQCTIKELIEWEQSNSNAFLIDPIERVKVLLHRGAVCDVVRECHVVDSKGRVAEGPPFVVLNAHTPDKASVLAAAGIEYPVLVKPMVAHGSREAHTISLVFNDKGLEDVKLPSYLVQHFVNHNAVLYKVFVIGTTHFTVKRPSIRDLHVHETDTITFDSALVSKAASASPLNIEGAVSAVTAVPDEPLLCSLLQGMREKFGLSLFGVDVVIESGTENLYVVDVNYFPGYNGGAGWQFSKKFAAFLQSRLGASPHRAAGESAVDMLGGTAR